MSAEPSVQSLMLSWPQVPDHDRPSVEALAMCIRHNGVDVLLVGQTVADLLDIVKDLQFRSPIDPNKFRRVRIIRQDNLAPAAPDKSKI